MTLERALKIAKRPMRCFDQPEVAKALKRLAREVEKEKDYQDLLARSDGGVKEGLD